MTSDREHGSATEHDRRVFDLVEALLELPPAERRGFLEGRNEPPAVVAEVLEILEGEDHLTQFLERPAVASLMQAQGRTLALGSLGSEPPDLEPSPMIGRQVGPYRIEEMLGAGGMGEVFRATQSEPVERQVALKVIRQSLAGRSLQSRFDVERRALARLTHPAIGQFYDAGTTPDGLAYLVMELVEGQPIDRYCDERQLSLQQRLELVIAVCRGVEHAHQRQLLHRDLKPSNILVTEVDGVPVPKIIDFGVAKPLDLPAGEMTVTGGWGVGTPSFMSPEALDGTGDVDTRSDLYSLGILLYQLLAGSRPFGGSDTAFTELVRRILQEDVPKASTRFTQLGAEDKARIAAARGLSETELARRLRGDLDWILLKATARDREQRYGSVRELAEDLLRHLGSVPVAAGPPDWSYRLGKLLRRHRFAVAAASVALFLLVGGIVGISLALVRAHQAEERARAEAQQATLAREEAESVVSFLTGLFRAAHPDRRDGLGNRRTEPMTALELLEAGTRKAEEELAEQPRARGRIQTLMAAFTDRSACTRQPRRFSARRSTRWRSCRRRPTAPGARPTSRWRSCCDARATWTGPKRSSIALGS